MLRNRSVATVRVETVVVGIINCVRGSARGQILAVCLAIRDIPGGTHIVKMSMLVNERSRLGIHDTVSGWDSPEISTNVNSVSGVGWIDVGVCIGCARATSTIHRIICLKGANGVGQTISNPGVSIIIASTEPGDVACFRLAGTRRKIV